MENINNKFTKDYIYNYYIVENHSYEELKNHLGVSYYKVDCLLREYKIKKDRKVSYIAGMNTKINKYGSKEAYEKHSLTKRKDTIIEKYGSEEEFKAQVGKKCSEIWQNMSEDAKKDIRKRIQDHGGGWNHETIARTLTNKYGVKNISEVKEIKRKQMDSLRKSNKEKLGIEWNCQLPQCIDAVGTKGIHTKPNEDFYNLLLKYIPENKIEREFNIEGKRYDFKVDNTLIEINPTITHNITFSPFNDCVDKNYHKNKTDLAKKYNFKCIHVWDWDSREAVINLLINRERVYARQCEIKEVTKEETTKFISGNHIQGYAKDEVRLGLYYCDNLVSIMTFGKPRYNKTCEWELIRYCSSCNVIGGSEKLFKYFINKYNVNSVISYCDLSKFTGDVYLKLGFTYKGSHLGKHWYKEKTKQHITDNLLRQRGFDQLFNTNYGKGTSNEELMLSEGFVELYDCGQATYVWTKPVDNLKDKK